MRRGRLSLSILLAFVIVPLGAFAGGTGPPPGQPLPSTGLVLDQKLTVGDITVSYPTGLEPQARELMAVCQSVIPPRKARFLAVEEAFSDQEAIVKRVADLLGCPEHAEAACQLLGAMEPVTETLLLPMLSDVRIYREADLKAAGGLNAGLVSLSYDPKTDQFTFQISAQFNSNTPTPSSATSFLPTIVRDDGTFRTLANLGLAEYLSDRLDEVVIGFAITVHAAMIHEVAESMLVSMGFFHPFARWFNEGAASWVQLQVVAQLAPEHLDVCREQFLPGPGPDPLRDKVNLLAWTQMTYEREFVLAEDRGVDEASYPYATELVDRLLRDQPTGALATIVARLKGSCSPDTDAICQAWREVTGKDARSMLLEYVPAHVRDGLAQGLACTKLQEGYQALAAGELPRAAARLKEALEMSPSDPDAHLSLAIIMRRALRGPQVPDPGTVQRRRLESERHIAIAAVLTRGDPRRQFQIHGPVDNEARYALGRAEQLRGRIQEAKEILSQLPKDHEDAQEALKEIGEGEKLSSPRPAGAASGA